MPGKKAVNAAEELSRDGVDEAAVQRQAQIDARRRNMRARAARLEALRAQVVPELAPINAAPPRRGKSKHVRVRPDGTTTRKEIVRIDHLTVQTVEAVELKVRTLENQGVILAHHGRAADRFMRDVELSQGASVLRAAQIEPQSRATRPDHVEHASRLAAGDRLRAVRLEIGRVNYETCFAVCFGDVTGRTGGGAKASFSKHIRSAFAALADAYDERRRGRPDRTYEIIHAEYERLCKGMGC